MKQIKQFYLLVILSFTLFSLNQCSGDSEILATFDGGTVTRGELNFFIQSNKRSADPEPVNSEIQSKIVENIALEKMLMLDSIKNQKVSQEDLQKLENLVSDFLKFNVYLKDYVKRSIESKPLEFVSLEMALIRSEDEAANVKKADEILAKLNSAKSSEISDILAEATDDVGRKPIGGKLEPFCTNCNSNPLEDIIEATKKAPKGEFIKYDKDPRMIYVLRITDTEKVNAKRVAKYYTSVFKDFAKLAEEYAKTHTDEQTKNAVSYLVEGDQEEKGKQFAQQMIKQFEQGLYQKESMRIKEAAGVEFGNLPPVFSVEEIVPKDYSADRVLLKYKDGSIYKWSDLEKEFAELPKALLNDYKDDKSKIFDMVKLFQSTLVQGKIAKTSPEVQKIGKKQEFLLQLDRMKGSLAFKNLQDEMSALKIEISPKQIQDTYEAGKLYAYSKADPRDPNKRIPLPFYEVKDKIKSELENNEKNAYVQKRVDTLKSSYNLKIDTSRLKDVMI
ncbi:hypothetical protein LPTSP4_06140 [Leptospira ryugenii]|uniref:PpiC domain-containing protein n=1 Tax=Leptospira ryugenii TaxID=1917863 RepID=A0A2P2DWU3_9LEPT|nr:hypothetical protein [Leptospira ryugenii]GBF49104.1 hypothetical protein LPTSP4_06140 [Leptospira ryugenii]